MKEELIQKLMAVLGALDNVYVRGKANMTNITGSMNIIEEVVGVLSNAEFAEPAGGMMTKQ